MRLILLGAPGAGKGTVAGLLVEKYSLLHLSTGDMLRDAIQKGTEVGKQAREYMDRGDLVPDEVIMGIMEERLAREDCANGFILDGFPRTIAQAKAIDEFLWESNIFPHAVVNLEVPEDVLLKRLTSRRTCSNSSCNAIYNIYTMPPEKEGVCDLCGGRLYQRDDETEEVISKRLATYKEKTAPVIGYYSGRNVFLSVSGLDKDRVVAEIEKHVDGFAF